MSELLDKAIQTGIIKYVQDVFQSKKKKKKVNEMRRKMKSFKKNQSEVLEMKT